MTEYCCLLKEQLQTCIAIRTPHRNRTPIDKERRLKILDRYNYTCQGCSLHCPEQPEHLEIHHRRPRSHGGNNNGKNLTLLCRSCHVWVHQEAARGVQVDK